MYLTIQIGLRDVSEPRVTVPEVAKQLGFAHNSRANMMAGNMARIAYEKMVGRSPVKELREKSNPKAKRGSSHDIAVYPLIWWERIAEIVRTCYAKVQEA